MKLKMAICFQISVFLLLASGCVSQAAFDEYVEANDLTVKILNCESRIDAYQDMIGSDEPNPTRRDEPFTTRRDELCQAELTIITDGHLAMCRTSMEDCTENTSYGAPQCRSCYGNCITSATGTWPQDPEPAGCTLPQPPP